MLPLLSSDKNTLLIDLIAGARPNFMKIAPIVRAIVDAQNNGAAISYRLVHTGQHYDDAMSGQFFRDLQLPAADVNLDVGSGTQAEQSGKIMIAYEQLLLTQKPAVCVVVGDVNSTFATAITARKCGVPVAHVEAGIRSRDWAMPEEINRVVTDSISNWYFTTSKPAGENLAAEGVSADNIFFVGNTMIDTLMHCQSRFKKPAIYNEYSLKPQGYIVLTLHRPANVDTLDSLTNRLRVINESAGNTPIVFPMHPRTRSVLKGTEHSFSNLIITEPLGYLEFNYLVSNAMGVITDSGGITEEATVLGIPCITMRDSTERPETVEMGTNELIGTGIDAIPSWVKKMCSGTWKSGNIPELWDGCTGPRIVSHLIRLLAP